jgi:predicted membrane channel-forming protein YqfA (hemolysin III family)
MESFIKENPWIIAVFIILAVWESVWKLIALWKTAGNKQLAWFVCIGIFNTVGILPIIYLLWFQKKPAEQAA